MGCVEEEKKKGKQKGERKKMRGKKVNPVQV